MKKKLLLILLIISFDPGLPAESLKRWVIITDKETRKLPIVILCREKKTCSNFIIGMKKNRPAWYNALFQRKFRIKKTLYFKFRREFNRVPITTRTEITLAVFDVNGMLLSIVPFRHSVFPGQEFIDSIEDAERSYSACRAGRRPLAEKDIVFWSYQSWMSGRPELTKALLKTAKNTKLNLFERNALSKISIMLEKDISRKRSLTLP